MEMKFTVLGWQRVGVGPAGWDELCWVGGVGGDVFMCWDAVFGCTKWLRTDDYLLEDSQSPGRTNKTVCTMKKGRLSATSNVLLLC